MVACARWTTSLFVVLYLAAGSIAWAQERQLWRFEIEGNTVFSDKELKEAIATRASCHFLPFCFKEYDPVVFQADQRRLEHYYRRNGYYQAAVERSDVTPCSSEGRVCATIRIFEGEPALISSINIKVGKSDPPLDVDGLYGLFGLQAGQIFNHDQYLAGKQALTRFLRKQSYSHPKVEGEALYSPATNSVAVDLNVVPGTKARIGGVRFDGLEDIKPEDAKKRLPIVEGEWYDPDIIEDSLVLLGDLDVFRSIDVELVPRAADPSIVDVVFYVREKLSKTLRLGSGIRIDNTRQEIRLLGEWTNRNFAGGLRKLRVRAEPRYAFIPTLFNPRESGPLGTLEVSQEQPAFLHPRQDLRVAAALEADLEEGFRWYGPRVSTYVDRRISRYFMATAGYSFQYFSFYNVDLTFSPDSELVPPELLFSESYRVAFLDQILTWDRRDNPLETRDGYYLQFDLSESATFLGSAFNYLRFRPDVRKYFPVTRWSTLALRAMYGQLWPLGGELTPTTERFYGGGANDHRGFVYHRLSPQTTTTEGSDVPIGGDVQFLATIEDRLRLFRISDSWLTAAFFLDAGDVVESPQDFDLGMLHYALGAGLRYATPVGVIRFDLAYRLNRTEQETGGRPNPDPGKPVAFHLSFGEAF